MCVLIVAVGCVPRRTRPLAWVRCHCLCGHRHADL